MCYYVNILIDALTISFKWDAISDLIDLLGIEKIIEKTQPRRNKYYSSGFYYPGLNVGYNVDQYGSITDCLLDLSGTGCRLIEQLNDNKFDWFAFLGCFDAELTSHQAHISRIDIACDIYDDKIDYQRVLTSVVKGHYICLSEKRRWIDGDERTIYFGSPQSNRLLRVYDKALEQGIEGKWIRFEFQLRNESAMSVYLVQKTCPDLSIGELYAGILKNYIRFVQVPRGQDINTIKANKNQSRLSSPRWWTDFVGDVEKLPQLYLPGAEYTIDRLEHYIKKQLASSLKAYMFSDELPANRIALLDELIKTILPAELNAKQEILLDQLKIQKARHIRQIINILKLNLNGTADHSN